MKKQEGYKCDFCNKMSTSKSGMMKHEAEKHIGNRECFITTVKIEWEQ